MAVQISGNDITVPRDGSFTRNVTIGGTLTYEDVTNIDSVGLVTARSGIEIGARPGVAASISVDGNMIVSGITTIGGVVNASSDIKVGSGITLSPDGDVFATGITTISKTGGNGELIVERAGGAGLQVQAQSALGVFGTTSSHDLRLISNGNGMMLISTNGNVTLNSGNLVIGTAGKGIDFSAQTASSVSGVTVGAEVLDHYEEGDWTPTLTNGETCSVYAASYTRIGRQVTAHCFIHNFSDFNGNSNTFSIEGLPFSKDSSNANYYGGGYIGFTQTMNYGYPLLPLVASTPHIYFHRQDGTTSTWKYQDFHNVGNGSGGALIVQVVYNTA